MVSPPAQICRDKPGFEEGSPCAEQQRHQPWGTPAAWAMAASLPAAAGLARAVTAHERDLRDFAAGNNLPGADVVGLNDHVVGTRRVDV